MAGTHFYFNWPQLALSIVGAIIAHFVQRRYRRRAMAKDHVAEVSRDVAIPLECVGCASPHAPFQFGVISNIWPRTYSMDTWRSRFSIDAWLSSFSMARPDAAKRKFVFHFCLRCSRALRRRRRLGTVVILAGVCWLLLVPLSVVLVKSSDAVRHLTNSGPSDWFLWFLILPFMGGPLLIATGITIYESMPPVSIVEGGGDTIFVSFRSQQFRDLFARLNGEDWTAALPRTSGAQRPRTPPGP